MNPEEVEFRRAQGIVAGKGCYRICALIGKALTGMMVAWIAWKVRNL